MLSDSGSFWKEQYEHLITLYHQEASRFWSRFQTSLAINGGLVVAYSVLYGAIIDGKGIANLGILSLTAISFFGIVLSSIWILLTKSGSDWQARWKGLGIELEAKHESELEIKIFTGKPQKSISVTKLALSIPTTFIVVWVVLFSLTLLVIRNNIGL